MIASYPHDVASFTQGLLIHDGRLLESTGGYGASALIESDLASGRALRRVDLPDEVFAEGIAIAGSRIVQLTWRSGVAFLYDLALQRQGSFRYAGEGWGLASDGERLIRSDGSATLRFHDAHTLAEVGHLRVHDGNRPVTRLNELEVHGARLYANVWLTDRIAIVDLRSGRVEGWLDLAALKKQFDKPPGWIPGEHVLNGIAYLPARGNLLVTGKCWPRLFEIRPETPAGAQAS